MWTLILIFLVSSQTPEYVTIDAEDGISCAAQGKSLKEQFDAGQLTPPAHVDDADELRWVCTGPDGEVITDKGE